MKKRFALVTGANEGIGHFIAIECAKRGYDIINLDINGDHADSLETAVSNHKQSLISLKCDVSARHDVHKAYEEVRSLEALPSLVWLNAGVGGMGGVLSCSNNDLDWMFDVNVKGVLNVLREFVKVSGEDSGIAKQIGLTASISAFTTPGVYSAAYGATKHAVVGIGEALIAELENTDISVTIGCPGLVNTQIWNSVQNRQEQFGGKEHREEHLGDHWRNNGMSAETVAKAMVDQMFDGGGYILPVDPHSQTDFDNRISEISKRFVFTA